LSFNWTIRCAWESFECFLAVHGVEHGDVDCDIDPFLQFLHRRFLVGLHAIFSPKGAIALLKRLLVEETCACYIALRCLVDLRGKAAKCRFEAACPPRTGYICEVKCRNAS
jgi:hypothetical protein